MDPAQLAAQDAVVDLDADLATCPACLGEIEKGNERCPGCGLRLF
ncbi:MAG: hypothetical protein ABGY32_14800 [bacterium]